jgi:hypothetical protein
MGLVLSQAYIAQTYACLGVASVSGFFTGMYVVLTRLFPFCSGAKRQSHTWLAIILWPLSAWRCSAAWLGFGIENFKFSCAPVPAQRIL